MYCAMVSMGFFCFAIRYVFWYKFKWILAYSVSFYLGSLMLKSRELKHYSVNHCSVPFLLQTSRVQSAALRTPAHSSWCNQSLCPQLMMQSCQGLTMHSKCTTSVIHHLLSVTSAKLSGLLAELETCRKVCLPALLSTLLCLLVLLSTFRCLLEILSSYQWFIKNTHHILNVLNFFAWNMQW